MEALIPIIYFLIVVTHAYIDYRKIKIKGQSIKHKTESFYYILVCFILFWVLAELAQAPILPLILFPLFTRAAFLDPFLNWFCGNHFLYEGMTKRNRDKSFFDNLEKSLGLPVAVYRIIYFALYIIWTGIYIFLYT